MKEKIDFFYHVTMDLENKEKEFIPRVPKYRCKDEDSTIPRVCVCPTLEGAVGAFPYKSYYINKHMNFREQNYLTYYKIQNNNLKYKTDEEIKDLVPDSHITNEHWILDKFKATPTTIKVKRLELSSYHSYINEYSGFVTEFEYEKSIENYDRTEEITFINKQFFNKAIKFANKNNISYEIIEDTYYNLWYRRYIIKNINFNGTTKKYRWIKVKFYIGKGIDISELWIINNNQENFAEKKNISIRPFVIKEKNRKDIIECLMNYVQY